MSKNRSNRNNKSVLKALRQKRANGGRLALAGGGRKNTNWYQDQYGDTDQYGEGQQFVPSSGPGSSGGTGGTGSNTRQLLILKALMQLLQQEEVFWAEVIHQELLIQEEIQAQ